MRSIPIAFSSSPIRGDLDRSGEATAIGRHVERLKSYPTDSYQLVYTTSNITPELDQSDYVVGDHYTMRNKSLKNV